MRGGEKPPGRRKS